MILQGCEHVKTYLSESNSVLEIHFRIISYNPLSKMDQLLENMHLTKETQRENARVPENPAVHAGYRKV